MQVSNAPSPSPLPPVPPKQLDDQRNSVSSDGGRDLELFSKRWPSFGTTVFPFRFLGHWFSRKFNVFPKKWLDDGDARAAEAEASVVLDDLVYGEAPRFRPAENALYLSDMFARQVLRVDLTTGERSVVYADPSDYVSGLGWLPDGRMLIVSMNKRVVLVHSETTGKTEQYADASSLTKFRANDLVVAADGRAYLGNFGFPVEDVAASCTTTLVSLSPVDAAVRVEARELMFPNGAVITPDGATLIVAETFEGQLTAFTIGEDGRLSNRRVWAKLGVPADGICLDAEGCVWVSVPRVGLYETSGGLLRVREGGEIVHMLGFGRNGICRGVFACQLATDAAGQHQLFFLEAASCKESDVFARGLSDPATANGALKRVPVRVGPARMAGHARYSGGYC